MTRAVYAGSFDPFTNGHLDIVRKASELFDEVVVVIAVNAQKTRTYSVDDMSDAISTTLVVDDLSNCTVDNCDGLIVDYMKFYGAKYLIRGLRDNVDYGYEENIAKINKMVNPDIETVYFRAESNVSSSMVKELYRYGKDVSEYVPYNVLDLMIHTPSRDKRGI